MWDVGRHPDNRTRRRPDRRSIDRQGNDAIEHENECLEWRRMRRQPCPAAIANSVRFPPAALASTRLAMPCSGAVTSDCTDSACAAGSFQSCDFLTMRLRRMLRDDERDKDHGGRQQHEIRPYIEEDGG